METNGDIPWGYFFFENRFAEDLCGYATKQLKELLIAIVGEND